MTQDKDRSEVTSSEETTETQLAIVEGKLASIDDPLAKLTSLIEENTPKKKPKPKGKGLGGILQLSDDKIDKNEYVSKSDAEIESSEQHTKRGNQMNNLKVDFKVEIPNYEGNTLKSWMTGSTD